MDAKLAIEPKGQGDDLLSSISIWRYVIPVLGVVLVTAYFAYFRELPAATDPDKWGTFGDYFGGIMNPVVAFAAFYWLTQSVKLQKQELAETREELRKAAQAQQETVRTAQVSVQLAALSALSTSTYSEIARIRDIMATISRNRPPDSEHVFQRMYDHDNDHTLARLNDAIKEAFAKREVYTKQMEMILAKNAIVQFDTRNLPPGHQ